MTYEEGKRKMFYIIREKYLTLSAKAFNDYICGEDRKE